MKSLAETAKYFSSNSSSQSGARLNPWSSLGPSWDGVLGSGQRDRGPTGGLSSPLGGRVGVQHPAALHPAPHRVHAGQRLLLQAAAAPLDALLDPEHQPSTRLSSDESRCLWFPSSYLLGGPALISY